MTPSPAPAPVRIRPAARDELPELAAIWAAAAVARRAAAGLPAAGLQAAGLQAARLPATDEQAAAESLLTARSELSSTFVLAAERDRLVGMAMAMQALHNDGAGPGEVPGLLHVSMVAVRPEAWGEGVGTGLVRAVLSAAGGRGFQRAQLWTHQSNARGRDLYARLGFARTGRNKLDDHGELIEHFECSIDPAIVTARSA